MPDYFFKLNGDELTASEIEMIKQAAKIAGADWRKICSRPNESTLLLESISKTRSLHEAVNVAIAALRDHDKKIADRQRAVFNSLRKASGAKLR